MRSKKELQTMIADGQLEEAAAAALAYAEAAGDVNTLNGLLALNSDLQQHRQVWLSGQISFEEFSRQAARNTQRLLDRVEALPNEPTARAAQSRMKEESFKWMVFYQFVVTKILVVGFAFFCWKVWAFTNEEALNTLNALLPGLILYGSIMFRELFRAGLDASAPQRYVARRFRTFAWIIFPVYALVQVFIVYQKAAGEFTFTMMNLALLGVEAGMGRFVGELVDGVFKKKEG